MKDYILKEMETRCGGFIKIIRFDKISTMLQHGVKWDKIISKLVSFSIL